MRNIKSVAFIATAALLQPARRQSNCRNRRSSSVPGSGPPPVRHPPRHPSGRNRAVDPLNDPKGVLANRSVYFDFDSYVVRDDGKPVVENHSAT
jgi:peptidoglycan-associated lipoprotein